MITAVESGELYFVVVYLEPVQSEDQIPCTIVDEDGLLGLVYDAPLNPGLESARRGILTVGESGIVECAAIVCHRASGLARNRGISRILDAILVVRGRVMTCWLTARLREMPNCFEAAVPRPGHVLLTRCDTRVSVDNIEHSINSRADSTLHPGHDLTRSSIVFLYLEVVLAGTIYIGREHEVGRNRIGSRCSASGISILDATTVGNRPQVRFPAIAIVGTREQNSKIAIRFAYLGFVDRDLGVV